ncbi:hypothetical protein C9374_007300 [Naegleria lovaniensis]|uniref:Major facilitator superfamily (MFS) profile domain-containing protein n=1 Tax=Naegleria lovaniensis TaxID=51637 RepID=A0AA88H5A2_NAELO|nr:uncharacterized protein C9374_007300 [Naegleria lovaniensis]KAG2393769.1 hypothetical protein C9374_007300 [Naegleria lovaniensis]
MNGPVGGEENNDENDVVGYFNNDNDDIHTTRNDYFQPSSSSSHSEDVGLNLGRPVVDEQEDLGGGNGFYYSDDEEEDVMNGSFSFEKENNNRDDITRDSMPPRRTSFTMSDNDEDDGYNNIFGAVGNSSVSNKSPNTSSGPYGLPPRYLHRDDRYYLPQDISTSSTMTTSSDPMNSIQLESIDHIFEESQVSPIQPVSNNVLSPPNSIHPFDVILSPTHPEEMNFEDGFAMLSVDTSSMVLDQPLDLNANNNDSMMDELNNVRVTTPVMQDNNFVKMKSKRNSSQKKKVRFSDNDILFPVTVIPASPSEDDTKKTLDFNSPSTNTVVNNFSPSTTSAMQDTKNNQLPPQIPFHLYNSKNSETSTNGEVIPSKYSNGVNQSDLSPMDHSLRNDNFDNNEDDEFKTHDGKKRLFGLTGYQYLVLASAWLGWAFDIFDGVLFSYAAPICIPNLLGFADDQLTSTAAKEQTALWSSILSSVLLFGWGCGGVFFGWLTDRVGRSKTMMITIVVYSIGTFLAAFSFHISVLVILRFIASLGIGGEWSAGAALISETLPIEKRVIGGVVLYTAAPIGSMASFAVNYLITSVLLQRTGPPVNGTVTNSTIHAMMDFVTSTDTIMSEGINAPVITGGPIPVWLSWRILFAIGVIPTIVGIFIRICVKEPDSWVEQQRREKEEHEQQENANTSNPHTNLNEDEQKLPTPIRSYANSILASPSSGNDDSPTVSTNSEDDMKEIDLGTPTHANGNLNGEKFETLPFTRSESDLSTTSSQQPLKKKRKGKSYLDLFSNADLRRRTISSILFVCPALISWWCISTFIPILSTYLASNYKDPDEKKHYQDLYSVLGNMLFNFGGLIGTLMVIPIATKFGRLWVYRIYFFFATVSIVVAFGIPDMSPVLRFSLMFPVGVFVFGAFGSFTFYLPELFPMELRGRGSGFTYNCGRFGTAIFPFLVGLIVSQGVNPLIVLSCISIATFFGFIVSVIPRFAVETKDVIIH